MANPILGQVAFDVGGRSYIFALGTYAFAALERRTGKTVAKFFTREKDEESGDEIWGMDDLLALFHAGLLRHQNRMTEAEVADVMDGLGMERVASILAEAGSLSREAPKEAVVPPKAARKRTG